ncbi:MAG: Holliday junction resolvase RuvX [Halanaerobiales bacterium]
MRIMALDYGNKRIGVAISDSLGLTAQGKGYIKNNNFQDVLLEINKYINKFDIEEIIVGMPFKMNGSKGERVERTQEFINFLKNNLKVNIRAWDERLTSVQAEKVLLEADMSREKRKQVIDKMAASLILSNYLEARKNK